MNVTLLAGLLLPWLMGSTLLASVRQFQGHAAHPGRIHRLLGYGFFIGYALLYALIMGVDALSGRVSLGAVMPWLIVLTVLSTSCLLILRKFQKATDTLMPDTPKSSVSRPASLLGALLLAWIGVHLLFATVDVLSIPVYPWDAWLVWMYRAKAWFYSGGLVDMLSPTQWAADSTVTSYTIDAFTYPDFPSVVGFWVALCLGRWSETLVNLPGLLCALATGLTLYGHTARLGLKPVFSIAVCYLLFSTPLYGAHIALGGYADIWMAGFAGLGFVSLVSGLARRETGYALLGLLLLTFSLGVKNEGAVWLLAGLGLLAFMTIPARVQWSIAGTLALLMGIAVLSGITAVELPMLGLLGFSEGQVHIPLIGAFPLQAHHVTGEYVENFFALGNWHALWPMVLAGLLVSAFHARQRAHRTVLGFLMLFVGTQAFIFGFTDQGAWASQYTAINRLPLQFLPALLFALAMLMEKQPGLVAFAAQSGQRPWLAPLTALGLVIVGTVGYLSAGAAAGTAQRFEPTLQFAVGGGTRDSGHISIESFQNGFAVLSSGPVDVVAEDFPFLRWRLHTELTKEPALSPALFWRSADQPELVSRFSLDGADLQRPSQNSNWTGRISEIGLILPNTGGRSPRLEHFSLESSTLSNRWHWTWHGWKAFEPWSLRSINFLWAGAEHQELRLPVVVLSWALLTLVLLRIPGLRAHLPAMTSSAIVLLVAWMALDVRWTLNGAKQFATSVHQGWGKSDAERLAATPEADIHELIQRYRQKYASERAQRFLVVGDNYDYEYYLQRAKYLLLPDSADTISHLDDELEPERFDYVMFVGAFAANRASWAQIWQQLPVSEGWRDNLDLADSNEMALLFSVRSD